MEFTKQGMSIFQFMKDYGNEFQTFDGDEWNQREATKNWNIKYVIQCENYSFNVFSDGFQEWLNKNNYRFEWYNSDFLLLFDNNDNDTCEELVKTYFSESEDETEFDVFDIDDIENIIIDYLEATQNKEDDEHFLRTMKDLYIRNDKLDLCNYFYECWDYYQLRLSECKEENQINKNILKIKFDDFKTYKNKKKENEQHQPKITTIKTNKFNVHDLAP
jgi:hypothetical protein